MKRAIFNFLYKNRVVIYYGFSMAGILFILRLLEYHFLILSHAFEIYAGVIALIFLGIGIWITLKVSGRKKVVAEIAAYRAAIAPNTTEIERLGLSSRELEVLQMMALGHSNEEIALELFVSINTIKTHASRLFEKLDAKRRTQAVAKARKLGIL